jgi:large subunit ribosomal protein L23
MSIFGKNTTKDEKQEGEAKPAVVKAVKKAKPEAKKSMKDLYGAGQEKTSTPVAETEAKVESAKKESSVTSASAAYRVLLRPLLTEKGSHLGVQNKYLFEVGYDTNKIEVAKAIEIVYGIKPSKVNIIKLAGKVMRRGRTEGKRKNWKKAIVTMPKGKTIQIYEGI